MAAPARTPASPQLLHCCCPDGFPCLPACLGSQLPLLGGLLGKHWAASSFWALKHTLYPGGLPTSLFLLPKHYPVRNEPTDLQPWLCKARGHRRDHLTYWFLKRAGEEQKMCESGPRATKGNRHPLGSQIKPKPCRQCLSLVGPFTDLSLLPFTQSPQSVTSLPAEPSSDIPLWFSTIYLFAHKIYFLKAILTDTVPRFHCLLLQ